MSFTKSPRRTFYEGFAEYTGRFEVEMCDAPCADPGFCCYSLCCHMCASYQLRVRALHNDMSRYKCCGGYHPCVGKMGEESCPEFCLCMEVFCCFPTSVMSTRFMIQEEMHIGNSACDDNLICLVAACECFACLVSIVNEDLGQTVHTISDMIYLSVCSCMQTQHHKQLEARDNGTRPVFVMTAPPTYQMMSAQQQQPQQQQQIVYQQQPPQQVMYQQPHQQPQQVVYLQPGQAPPPGAVYVQQPQQYR